MSNCCSHGTFLHFSLQRSHLNIFYYHQDLQWQLHLLCDLMSVDFNLNVASCEHLSVTGQVANSIRFPFNGFTYFLTLFSNSFSSFPHGTYSYYLYTVRRLNCRQRNPIPSSSSFLTNTQTSMLPV